MKLNRSALRKIEKAVRSNFVLAGGKSIREHLQDKRRDRGQRPEQIASEVVL